MIGEISQAYERIGKLPLTIFRKGKGTAGEVANDFEARGIIVDNWERMNGIESITDMQQMQAGNNLGPETAIWS